MTEREILKEEFGIRLLELKEVTDDVIAEKLVIWSAHDLRELEYSLFTENENTIIDLTLRILERKAALLAKQRFGEQGEEGLN